MCPFTVNKARGGISENGEEKCVMQASQEGEGREGSGGEFLVKLRYLWLKI